MFVPSPKFNGADFEAWTREREQLEAELDSADEETQPARREALLSRLADVEQLILTTECQELPAVRAKAHLLQWLMEMERADGLPAIRHIAAFLDTLG